MKKRILFALAACLLLVFAAACTKLSITVAKIDKKI